MKHWGEWFVAGRYIWRRNNKEGLYWRLPVEFDSEEDAQKVMADLNEQERLNQAYWETGLSGIYREWCCVDGNIFRNAIGGTEAYVLPLSKAFKEGLNETAIDVFGTLIATGLNLIEQQNKEEKA